MSPAPVTSLAALAYVLPTTSGTATSSRPLDLTQSTAVPGGTEAPAVGDWLTMCPTGALLKASVMVPSESPAPVIVLTAAASGG